MINRTAVILKYKAPAIKWINEIELQQGDKNLTSEEDVNSNDQNIYLISEDENTPESTYIWCEQNYKILFMTELEDWYIDKKLWPNELSYKLFNQWFDINWHSTIIDTVDNEPLLDE